MPAPGRPPLAPGPPTEWEYVRERQLEQGFDLRTCNVGGAHSELLENRPEHRRRSGQTIIPDYNAFADPHLRQYHQTNGNAHRSPAGFAGEIPSALRLRGGGGMRLGRKERAALSALSPHRGKDADGEARGRASDAHRRALRRPSVQVTTLRSRAPPQSYIVSTEQVLELKRLFWRHSADPAVGSARVISTVRSADAAAAAAADGGGASSPSSENFAFVYFCGVNAVNVHRRLQGKLPIAAASMERLWHALHVLGSGEEIDWPAFLLLCTVDLSDAGEYRRLLLLKDSFTQYTQSNPVQSERDFASLVVHLNGGREIADNTFLKSFFQQGDFYRSRGRGFGSFPEAIFCLYEFFTQVYIARARARGQHLAYNFTGHGVPGNIGGPARWARGRPRSCPPSLKRAPFRPYRDAATAGWTP